MPYTVDLGEDFAGGPAIFNMTQVWRAMATDLRTRASPQCGHLCHEERPGIVNGELLAFLAGWSRA